MWGVGRSSTQLNQLAQPSANISSITHWSCKFFGNGPLVPVSERRSPVTKHDVPLFCVCKAATATARAHATSAAAGHERGRVRGAAVGRSRTRFGACMSCIGGQRSSHLGWQWLAHGPLGCDGFATSSCQHGQMRAPMQKRTTRQPCGTPGGIPGASRLARPGTSPLPLAATRPGAPPHSPPPPTTTPLPRGHPPPPPPPACRFFFLILVNVLSSAGALGSTNADISARFDTPLTPKGYARPGEGGRPVPRLPTAPPCPPPVAATPTCTVLPGYHTHD